jgi:hypothetical protein
MLCAPTMKINVPVVMAREAVAAVTALMDGTAQVVTKLLYGRGLSFMEGIRCRGMARSTCPMHCSGRLRMSPRHGASRMSSPPGTSP